MKEWGWHARKGAWRISLEFGLIAGGLILVVLAWIAALIISMLNGA
ncbi:hypothetical protein FIU90_00475 [Erythrobacter sp. THAF29]|nr:hypothetical protein FIU90_00475 [Erythrobacter sp. THAF29]